MTPRRCSSAALGEELAGYPFLRARTLFSFGRWLRRQRRSADSRAPLRDAIDLFDALGATRWSERARQELRATGEKIGPRTPDARDRLTAQELQIAQLAAAGLSNREIGERLFLSHRTIGSHLYRIFPKLGITARAQLRDALSSTAYGEPEQSVDSSDRRREQPPSRFERSHQRRADSRSPPTLQPGEVQMSELPNIVLVHGAWADGSSWSGRHKARCKPGLQRHRPAVPGDVAG